MYEPTRHVSTFKIAGFQRYDGALVLDKMKVGATLEMGPERDNPYDPNAIAICFQGAKIGYVPKGENSSLAQLMFYGHADVFELRVIKLDQREDPWDQVLVGLYVADAR